MARDEQTDIWDHLPGPQGRPTVKLGAAAKRLGVHPNTLRRWVDEGLVTCARTPGGQRRFSPGELDRVEHEMYALGGAFRATRRSEPAWHPV